MSISSIPETPRGVVAVLTSEPPARTALTDFLLLGKVAIVTGGRRGIGLEVALAMAEAGAAVYCLDLPASPDDDWAKVHNYAAQLPSPDPNDPNAKGRLEYICADVTDQTGMWMKVEEIVKREGRLDICVAGAGILKEIDCLEWPAEEFKKLIDVNVNGCFFTAQAAARQMERLNIPGSIIMIASLSGTIANKGRHWVAYNTSKAAVVQMARSMACELGSKGIRVNSVSPGYIFTEMTRQFLDAHPHLLKEWSEHNPLGRLGRPDELRGVVLWLASSASTFCTGSDIIVDGGHRAW